MGNCLPISGGREEDLTPLENNAQEHARNERSARNSNDSSNDSNPPPYVVTQTRELDVVRGCDGRIMTEDQQMQLARRLGLIQHLPSDIYVQGGKGGSECIICMIDFMDGDPIRFLPCLHTYHTICIDDWLVRQFTCPQCMEPVDSALLCSYQTAELTELSELGTSPAMKEEGNENQAF